MLAMTSAGILSLVELFIAYSQTFCVHPEVWERQKIQTSELCTYVNEANLPFAFSANTRGILLPVEDGGLTSCLRHDRMAQSSDEWFHQASDLKTNKSNQCAKQITDQL